MRARHPQVFADGRAHPGGACALLDDQGACRVYADRPYVCRTQGLPLRWLEAGDAHGEVVEGRDICPLNADGGPPVESLPPDLCWPIGPFESRLLAMQQSQDGGEGRRVLLRDLFGAPDPGPAPPPR